ncbi:MAG TPA: superoxide dismutase [Ni] [Bacteroidales bacterium]|nr:superoxide dismutase [Ni] [Bacteroidales bacterium]
MKKILLQIIVGCFFIFILSIQAYAHCEIPCGIYDDEMRIKIINEHIVTVEKSMKQIIELEKDEHHNSNQLVRWIMNKEHHADEIQEIVSQYFMTQRIKLDMENYEKQLGFLHQMLIYSMKCKQTTDLNNVTKLKSIVDDFEALYFKKK